MKLGMLSWNGARHDVVFFVSILEKAHSDNDSLQRHFEKKLPPNISNVCIIQNVCVLLTIQVTPRVLVLMVVGGVVWTTG